MEGVTWLRMIALLARVYCAAGPPPSWSFFVIRFFVVARWLDGGASSCDKDWAKRVGGRVSVPR